MGRHVRLIVVLLVLRCVPLTVDSGRLAAALATLALALAFRRGSAGRPRARGVAFPVAHLAT
eukprot:83346-Alexandrium_andersonii.AAC.1